MFAPVVAQLWAVALCNEVARSHGDGVRVFSCSGGAREPGEETEGLEKTKAVLQGDLLQQLAL